MAYAVPQQWQHGDYPTAARLNLYKDGIDAIHAAIGDYTINPGVVWLRDPVNAYYLIHRHRWLLYRGDGEIEDPAGVGETISLPGDGTNFVGYDLDLVSWLFPGKLYRIKAIEVGWEDYEAL